MRLFRFILGALIIVAVVMVLFQPTILRWLIAHPYLDGVLGILGIAFHWFNTYAGVPPWRITP